MEFMPPQGDGKTQREGVAGRFSEFLQFGAEPRDLDSYRGVVLGIEIRRSPKRVYGDGILAYWLALVLPKVEE
jgi:hypothetical protein